MNGDAQIGPSRYRYGPTSFFVAVVHVLLVEVGTWLFFPYSLVFVIPGVLVYLAIAALVALASGIVGQIGRGMLLGSLAAPLSMIIFGAVWAIASAVGPL